MSVPVFERWCFSVGLCDIEKVIRALEYQPRTVYHVLVEGVSDEETSILHTEHKIRENERTKKIHTVVDSVVQCWV